MILPVDIENRMTATSLKLTIDAAIWRSLVPHLFAALPAQQIKRYLQAQPEPYIYPQREYYTRTGASLAIQHGRQRLPRYAVMLRALEEW